MSIHAFAVENYKGFRDLQTVKLGKLTLFYGENSSGKSALLRVLPWIAESMADTRPGPRLDGDLAREALWRDLVHFASPSRPIELQLWVSEQRGVVWNLRGGSALPNNCELASIELVQPGETRTLHDDGDGTWRGEVPGVSGMLPTVDGPTAGVAEGYRLKVQWLQGVRAPVPRVEKTLGSPPGELAPNGEGVARFLYFWDRVARTDATRGALEFVYRFYERLGFAIRPTDVAPGYFRIDVGPKDAGSGTINLVDTGEGLTQVLAPLVALARAAHGLGPAMVAIEQPELHLHTDAQRSLAVSIAEAAVAGAQVLVETHSEVLLAATQIAVADPMQPLTSDDVALYWVERRADLSCRAERVHMDERGRVGGAWPIDAFNDLLRLKGELIQAQRGHR